MKFSLSDIVQRLIRDVDCNLGDADIVDTIDLLVDAITRPRYLKKVQRLVNEAVAYEEEEDLA